MKAIIVDLDGTLANCEHRRHFVDGPVKSWPDFYAGMGKDAVNENVAELIKRFSSDHEILFVTGRPANYSKDTIKWLFAHLGWLPGIRLFMRAEGDFRKDCVVKREIYERDIKPRYDVRFTIDDRDQVVEMWRSLGLECWQVAVGDF